MRADGWMLVGCAGCEVSSPSNTEVKPVECGFTIEAVDPLDSDAQPSPDGVLEPYHNIMGGYIGLNVALTLNLGPCEGAEFTVVSMVILEGQPIDASEEVFAGWFGAAGSGSPAVVSCIVGDQSPDLSHWCEAEGREVDLALSLETLPRPEIGMETALRDEVVLEGLLLDLSHHGFSGELGPCTEGN